MLGYWNNPAATSETIVDDGWYHTGDIAWLGRRRPPHHRRPGQGHDHLGGLNVYPAEVERVLAQHADIADVCVVGLPDDRWGEVVAAAVVRRAGSALRRRRPRATGAARSWPATRSRASWRFSTNLPKGSTGKISKREVRLVLAKGRDGA